MLMSFAPLIAKIARRLPPVHWRVWWIQRRLRQFFAPRYIGRPDDWTVINDYDGNLKLKLRRSTYLGSVIEWHGYHSSNGLRLLERLLAPDMTFIDIGANSGAFSLFVAKRLPKGRVFAFEPIPHLFALLRENIALNHFDHMQAYNLALSDQPGHITMYTSSDSAIHAGVNEGLASLFPGQYRSEVAAEVEVSTLDTVLASVPRIDMIKIDVEGAELHVLRGGTSLIQKHKPILMLELNREALNAAGTSSEAVLAELTALGYRCERIANDVHGTPMPLDRGQIPDLCDILCRQESPR